MIEGQAKGLQTRSEQKGESFYETIWTFRLERYDESGNRVQLIPVEMRASSFEGTLSDGDWIRARGKLRRGTFRATDVENLTTGASVRAKQVPAVLKLLVIIVFVAIVAFIGWIGWSIVTADTGFPDDSEFPTGHVTNVELGDWP